MDFQVPDAPLLPLARCRAPRRRKVVSALFQAAHIDPGEVEDLPKPQQIVYDLAGALETSEKGPALADVLACSPYMILLLGRFMEAFGKWQLHPDTFSAMAQAARKSSRVPLKQNSLTRFSPYEIPEAVARTITETIVACGELTELSEKVSWPLPHVIRPSGLEGEADFLYHLILAIVRGDDVLSYRDVLTSGATIILWVGGLLVALGDYHAGDREAITAWAEDARSLTIASLREVLEAA